MHHGEREGEREEIVRLSLLVFFPTAAPERDTERTAWVNPELPLYPHSRGEMISIVRAAEPIINCARSTTTVDGPSELARCPLFSLARGGWNGYAVRLAP
jgi:hypothetical protein